MIKKIYCSVFAILFASVFMGQAVTITVEWDPAQTTTAGDPLENVDCYKVYYGESSGTYTDYVIVTNGTRVELTDLEYNKTLYFAVKTCTDTAESDFSEELVWTAPVMADADADGLSDDWEVAYFGSLDVAAGSQTDCDGNGICDLTEFISGTNPIDPDDHPVISISAGKTISFEARPASGEGYQNRARTYCLEYCEDLSAANWVPVPDMDNILAEGQVVNYDLSATGRSGYYRTQICLN